MCYSVSFVVGLVFSEIINRVAFSKAVQKKPINRILTYAAVFLIFLIAQYISIRWMGVSMLNYVKDELPDVIGMPILGFESGAASIYLLSACQQAKGLFQKAFLFDSNPAEPAAEIYKRQCPAAVPQRDQRRRRLRPEGVPQGADHLGRGIYMRQAGEPVDCGRRASEFCCAVLTVQVSRLSQKRIKRSHSKRNARFSYRKNLWKTAHFSFALLAEKR